MFAASAAIAMLSASVSADSARNTARQRPGVDLLNVGVDPSQRGTGVGRRQVDRRGDAVRERLRTQRARDERAGITLRDWARCEPPTGEARFGQPVDSKAPPVVATNVERHEIPPPSGSDELVRLDQPTRLLTLAAAVLEPNLDMISARLAEHGECLRVDGGAGAPLFTPSDRRDARMDRADSAPQAIRQHLFQLRERTSRGVAHAIDGGHGSRAQPDADRHRLVIVEEQRRQMRASGEPVAACLPGRGVDGIAERPQPIDVSPQRALADFEAVRQLGARPEPVRLQE